MSPGAILKNLIKENSQKTLISGTQLAAGYAASEKTQQKGAKCLYFFNYQKWLFSTPQSCSTNTHSFLIYEQLHEDSLGRRRVLLLI